MGGEQSNENKSSKDIFKSKKKEYVVAEVRREVVNANEIYGKSMKKKLKNFAPIDTVKVEISKTKRYGKKIYHEYQSGKYKSIKVWRDEIYCGTSHGKVGVFKVFSIYKIKHVENIKIHTGEIRQIGVYGDDENKYIATVSSDYVISIHDLVKKKSILAERSNDNSGYSLCVPPKRYFRKFVLITGHYDGAIKFWNHKLKKKIVRTLNIHSQSLRSMVAMSVANQDYLISAGWCRVICITKLSTELDTIRCIRRITTHKSLINRVRVMGNYIISVDSGRDILVHNPVNGKLVKSYVDKSAVWSLEVLGGKRFMTGGSDKDLKVWNLEDNKALARMGRHAGCVFSCAVMRKKNLLISASSDLKFWFYKDNYEKQMIDEKERMDFLLSEHDKDDVPMVQNILCSVFLPFFPSVEEKKKIVQVVGGLSDEMKENLFYLFFDKSKLISDLFLFDIYDFFQKVCSKKVPFFQKVCDFIQNRVEGIIDDDVLLMLFAKSFKCYESVKEVKKTSTLKNSFTSVCLKYIGEILEDDKHKKGNFRKRMIDKVPFVEDLLKTDIDFHQRTGSVTCGKINEIVRKGLFKNLKTTLTLLLTGSDSKKEKIYAHKEYLIFKSHFFYLMFRSQFAESLGDETEISQLTSLQVRSLVQFFYLGHCKINLDIVIYLYQYSIQYFEYELEEYLHDRLHKYFSKIKKDLSEQIEKYGAFIFSNFPEEVTYDFMSIWQSLLSKKEIGFLVEKSFKNLKK